MSNDIEDAKVREFIQVADGHQLNDDYRVTDWDRAQYSRVREHFTREVTE
ncbi:hypothetical protein ACFYE2_00620 [Kocuria sp. CPCC 205300]